MNSMVLQCDLDDKYEHPWRRRRINNKFLENFQKFSLSTPKKIFLHVWLHPLSQQKNDEKRKICPQALSLVSQVWKWKEAKLSLNNFFFFKKKIKIIIFFSIWVKIIWSIPLFLRERLFCWWRTEIFGENTKKKL